MAAPRMGSRRSRSVDRQAAAPVLHAGLSGCAHSARRGTLRSSTGSSGVVVVASPRSRRGSVSRRDVGHEVDRTGPACRVDPHKSADAADARRSHRRPCRMRDPTRRRHTRDDARPHRLRHRQAARSRRGRCACRCRLERHRRQGARHRGRGRGASRRPRTGAAEQDARPGRRRSRIALRVADPNAVRAGRVSATRNTDSRRRRIRHSRRRHRYGLARLPRRRRLRGRVGGVSRTKAHSRASAPTRPSWRGRRGPEARSPNR